MKHVYILTLLLLNILPVFATDYVLISEVLYDSPLNEDSRFSPHNYGEFVELHNVGQREADISGWHLETSASSQAYTFPANTILPPGAFLVLAYGAAYDYASSDDLDDELFESCFHDFYYGSLYPLYDDDTGKFLLDIQFQSAFSLANEETVLKLIDNLNTVRDSLVYGTSALPQLVAANSSCDYGFSAGSQCTSLRRMRAKFTIEGCAIFDPLEWASNIHDQNPAYGTTLTPGYSLSPIYVSSYLLPTEQVLSGKNYIRKVVPLEELSEISDDDEELSDHAMISYSYYDAMLRPECTSLFAAGRNKSNLISRVEYDEFGRKTKETLPLVADQDVLFLNGVDFLHHASYCYSNESRPYVNYLYSNDVLPGNVLANELIAEQSAGADMRGHNKTQHTTSNSPNEIKRYRVNDDGTLSWDGYYDEQVLVCEIRNDEDNHQMAEYRNRQNNVILSSMANVSHTYYVYDDLNRLTYVLPPNASPFLTGTSIPETNEYIRKFCYVYRYDGRGNCIYKRLPGCEPVRMLYDDADRIVLSQDGNQSRLQVATHYEYDIWGRLVKEDLVTISNDFPENSEEVGDLVRHLMEFYYDDYNFISEENLSFNEDYVSHCGNMKQQTTGLVTGKRVYDLSDVGSSTITVYYYDERERLIQQHSLAVGQSINSVYNKYSFNGKAVETIYESSFNGNNLVEYYYFLYDHVDRLVSTRYQLADDAVVLLDSIVYDDYGRITKKYIHGGIDSIGYNYNIRSQVTRIKSTDFEENLYYTSSPSALNASSSYNGNISALSWSYGNSTNTYTYRYDAYNRLSSATGTLNGNYADYFYSESFSYDKQGNVLNLIRWDNNDIMNYLSMQYDGNQLTKVTDNGYNPILYDEKRYQDGSNEQKEFFYDENGNLIYDSDRKICSIRYNLLNLPDIIQFKNGDQIVHVYDAEGNRRQTTYYTRRVKTVVPAFATLPASDNPQEYSVVSYANDGNKRYVRYGSGSWQLDYVFNPEGYTRYYGVVEHYPFYYIKDHLGTIRETYVTPEPGYRECVQRMQYYPSGLPWNNDYSASEQPFKYNGKEFVEMHGLDEYDSEARWYYPAIMRTTTMDPLCEKYYSTSPYAWCGNNPVNYVDSTGMWIEVSPNGDGTYLVVNGVLDQDRNIYILQEGKRNGEVLGQMYSKYSFFDEDEHVVSSIIDPKDQSGIVFIKDVYSDTPRLEEYIKYIDDYESNQSGRNFGRYDFKSKGKTKKELEDLPDAERNAYYYRGMPMIIGETIIYGSARDFGNFAAGYIAGRKGLGIVLTLLGFDVYQGNIEPPVSRAPQLRGYFTGIVDHFKNLFY